MMAKPNNNATPSDDGNWNGAKRYSDVKILGLLETIDKYEIIARIGFSNPDEVSKNSNIDKLKLGYLKFQGFKFLVDTLLQLIRNTKFALGNYAGDIDSYFKKLTIIQNVIISEIEENVSSNKLDLPEDYNDILFIVEDIKCKINTPLNKNNLIFLNRQETSIEEQIKQDEEDFINLP